MTRLTERTDLHRRQQYARELDAIARRFDRLDDTTLRRIIAMLQDLRRDIALTILDNPSSFEIWRLTDLKRSIEDSIARFQSRATGELAQALQDAGRLGIEMVDSPLTAAGIGVSFNTIAPQIANVAADFSAMLITNISDQLRGAIDTQLRLAILGTHTPFQLMKSITQAMGINAYDGVWGARRRPDVVRGVAARAETIVRTELSRALNLASYSRAQQVAEQIPGMQRVWIASADERTRQAHLQAHIDTHRQPIGISEPFIVDGEPLRMPGDPMGKPGNTINCRCRVALVVPSIGVIPSPLDILIDEQARKRER